MMWTDLIDVMNFLFIASDVWIIWSILIIALTVIISIGKNK